ncbi:MAG: cystathionine beta-synthase [Acidobacteria bacterium]|nr:MAG: cystathionine beta-synthase [Acidobacteriota bacterium]
MWYENILEVIGNTPMVRLNRVARGLRATLLAKLEYLNPGGSVKDRIGITMLEAAENAGKIKPGGTVIEGTSGNTGMGLALAATIKGYQCIFTMPDKMSQEKIDSLRALGAEVIVTPTEVDHHDPRSYHSVALRLSREIPNSIYPNQYENPANTQAHYETTGPEIWQQTDGKVTHVVIGVGTGGTITGIARFLKEKNPDIRVIGVDPQGSIFAEMFRTGVKPQIHPYKVEGIGQTELPGNVDFSVIDEIHAVSDKDAFLRTRLLARFEGIFAGGSSGAVLHVALKCAEKLTENDIVVILVADSGTRYLSKIYNDNWMRENQFLEPRISLTVGQVLHDKVRRTGQLVSIPLGVTVEEAVNLMREHDISQVPIIEGGEVVGSMSETGILNILVSDPVAKRKPVAEYMEKPFPVISEGASLTELAQSMDKQTPAILVKQASGFDIITKSDLIFFLTRQKT